MKLLINIVVIFMLGSSYITNVFAKENTALENLSCNKLLEFTIQRFSGSYKDKLRTVKNYGEFYSSVKFIYDDVLKIESKSIKCIRINDNVYGDTRKKEKYNKALVVIREAGEVHKASSGLRVHVEHYVSSKSINNKKYYKRYVNMLNKYIAKYLIELEKKK